MNYLCALNKVNKTNLKYMLSISTKSGISPAKNYFLLLFFAFMLLTGRQADAQVIY